MAPRGMMKVGISMLQIIASANDVYSIPWPPAFSGFLDTMKVFLVGDCPSRDVKTQVAFKVSYLALGVRLSRLTSLR